MDIGGPSWTHVDTGGHRWTKVDMMNVERGGRRWIQVGASKTVFSFFVHISICKVGLYNLNDSVEGPATFTFLFAFLR